MMAEEYYAGDDGGNWDYVPEDTGYYDPSFDPNQYSGFDLASMLADQGVIPFDDYGAPDLSVLYGAFPDYESLISGGVTPEEISGITGGISFDLSTLAANADPSVSSDVQDLGNGLYQVGDQMMDSVQLMDYINKPSLIDSLKGDQFGFSRSAYSEDPRGMGLFGVSSVQPAQSYRLPDGTVVGMTEDGADVQNPYDFKQVGDETYIMNNNTGRPIGYLDANNQEQYYQQDRMENNAARGFSSGILSKLGNLTSGINRSNNNAVKALTKGQTSMNTASALAQLAAALAGGGKGTTAPNGNKERGADGWTVGRAAGSGRKSALAAMKGM